MIDKVQKNNFTCYSTPSLETFRLPFVHPIGSMQTELLCASLCANGNINRKFFIKLKNAMF
jgi:hypothetical protein